MLHVYIKQYDKNQSHLPEIKMISLRNIIHTTCETTENFE